MVKCCRYSLTTCFPLAWLNCSYLYAVLILVPGEEWVGLSTRVVYVLYGVVYVLYGVLYEVMYILYRVVYVLYGGLYCMGNTV